MAARTTKRGSPGTTRGTKGGRTDANTRRAAARRCPGGPLRTRWGRVGVLVLVLVAAGLYYSPLREYFGQQDRYAEEAAVLTVLKRQNKAMEEQLEAMRGELWVVREARAQFQLVPRGMQAFVVNGLPSDEEVAEPAARPVKQSLTWADRLKDLFETLLH